MVPSRQGNRRQTAWDDLDIIEVVHTAIGDLMAADWEKAGLDPKMASNAAVGIGFNIVHHHPNVEGQDIAGMLKRERGRDDLVFGFDELIEYIGDTAGNYQTWGQLGDHEATPVVEVIPNPYYLDRLAYVTLAVAKELAYRGNNALATLRKLDLEVDGTRGALDDAWLVSGAAVEGLDTAVGRLERIMNHEIAGEPMTTQQRIRTLSQAQVDSIANSKPNRSGTGICQNCHRPTLAISPFCDECGCQWRTILPADEPLDGVGNLGRLPEDHNAQPERYLRNDAVRDAISQNDLESLMIDLSEPLIDLPAQRECVRFDCKMLHAHDEPTCQNCGSATVPDDAEQLGNCLLCGCGIFNVGDGDPVCHNGCDDLKGDRRRCNGCTAGVPLNFAYCPACGSDMGKSPMYENYNGNIGPF